MVCQKEITYHQIKLHLTYKKKIRLNKLGYYETSIIVVLKCFYLQTIQQNRQLFDMCIVMFAKMPEH